MRLKDIYRVGGLIAGIMIFASAFFVQPAWSGHTDVLLLSCMDYRLINETENYMTGRGLRDKYDHVILAGASLGALTDKYPAWNQTFWDHLDVSLKLHGVKKVVILDHRDCGAYKTLLGEDFAKDPAKETSVHIHNLAALASMIKARQPKLEVELLLMDLSGKVEPISPLRIAK